MNESQHRVAKQKRILSVVEPPRHFVKVGRKMPGAPLIAFSAMRGMPRASHFRHLRPALCPV